MVDPTTANRGLAQPTRGSDVGTWDVPVNGNMGLLDTIVGGITSIATTGGATVLSPAQLACGTITVTGALGSAASMNFPGGQGWWTIQNLTTGGFPLQALAGTGAEIIAIPPGEIIDIQVNGNSVRFRNLARIGTYIDYATTVVPGWISGCTIPPYLLCDGSSFSAGTYPYLNTILGGTTLPDFRGRARFYLNGGTGRLTVINGNVIGSAGGDQLLQGHVHGVVGNTGDDSPDHTHSINGGNAFTVGSTSVGSGPSSPSAAGPATLIGAVSSGASTRHQHFVNLTSQSTGSGGSQNIPPSAVGGITMIRAG